MRISEELISSAGTIIISNSKIILLKPKGLSKGHYSIPKGIIEDNETPRQAAIRETFEEIGLNLDKSNLGEQFVVNYFNKGVLTKRVFCYLVKLKFGVVDLEELILQKDEVDSVGLYNKNEAMELIFWRFRDLLENKYIWT